MKRIMFIITIISSFTSCSIDNFEAPNGGIQGKIIDKITGKGLQAQQPNGFTVKLYEKGWSSNSPINIPAKPDGSFENSFIFQDTYKVIPTQGAFFPPDTQVVKIKNRTEVSFEVMPYLAVTDAKITPNKKSITVGYKIDRQRVSGKIIERRTLVSEIPTVNTVSFDFQKTNDLSTTPDDKILNTHYTDVIDGLESGKTYYVRIAVRTDNELSKYNFSKIYPVEVQ